MSLDAEFQTALADIIEQVGGVAIAFGGVSGLGLSVQYDQATEFSDRGETGVTTRRFRVSTATFATRPQNGATIMADGSEYIVSMVVVSCGIMRIDCQKVRKIDG